MKKSLLLLILAISTTIAFSQTEKKKAEKYLEERGELVFTFTANNIKEVRELANLISFDHGQDTSNPLVINAIANQKGFDKFLEFDLPYIVDLEKNEPKKGVYMYDPLIHGKNSSSSMAYTLTFPLTAYPTYAQYESQMNDFATDHSSIAQLVDIGNTVNGKDLLFIKLSDNVTTHEQEPRILLTSSMHGDEIAGYPMMLSLIDFLIEVYNDNGHARHTEIKNLIDNSEVWINPMANPDGTYFGSAGYTSVSGARRANANNLDLNRNYPDPRVGAHPDGEVYQPETLAFMAMADSYHFVMGGNMHGGAEVFNYAWDTYTVAQGRHVDDEWYKLIGQEYALHAQADGPSGYFDDNFDAAASPGVTHGATWYQVAGGRQDYMNHDKQCRESTFELSNTKIIPAGQIENHWDYNRDAFIDFIKQGMYGFTGLVKDANTLNPIQAKITVVGHDDSRGSWVNTEMPIGDYYRPIEAGTYDLLFEADCYQSFTLTNQVITDGTTVNLADVLLTPSLINSFPYNESFETVDLGAWTQSDLGDIGWTRNQGSTPSTSATGPDNASDNNNNSFYLYTEASAADNGNPDKSAYLSTCVDFTQFASAELELLFDFHMYGSNMGTLSVEASINDGASYTSIFSISGQQHAGNETPWTTATVDLSTYVGQTIKLRFYGLTGNDWRSDIAIDNINITSDNFVLGTSSFDISEWTIYPNPSSTGMVNIKMPNDIQNFDVSISNVIGQEIYKEKVITTNSRHTINTKSLKAGIYFMTISTENIKSTKKIVIQ